MEDQNKRLNLSRPFEVLIGCVTGAISIALLFLCYLLLDKGGFLTTVSDPKTVTILSIPVSFATFFSIITYKLLITRNRLRGGELMSNNRISYLLGKRIDFFLLLPLNHNAA
jgi:hypothetical protein